MSKIHLSEQHIKKITIKANHNRANTFIVNVAYFILYKYKSFRRPCKRAFLNNYTKKTGTICYLLLFHCCRSLHVFIIFIWIIGNKCLLRPFERQNAISIYGSSKVQLTTKRTNLNGKSSRINLERAIEHLLLLVRSGPIIIISRRGFTHSRMHSLKSM